MTELIGILIGSLFRMVLLALFGVLIERGYMTEGQMSQLALGLGGFVVVAGYALWNHYKNRLKFLTALASPAGTDEATVKAKLATGGGAKLLTLFLALAVFGAGSVGCAAKTPLAKAQVGALSASQAALGIDQLEYDAYTAGLIDAEAHRRVGVPIRSLLYAVRGYERAVAAWTGDPYAEPSTIAKAKAAVAASIADLETALAPVQGADKLRVAIRALKLALGLPVSALPVPLPEPSQAGLPILALLALVLKIYQERDKEGTAGHFLQEMVAALKRSGVSPEELAAVDAELSAAIARRETEQG